MILTGVSILVILAARSLSGIRSLQPRINNLQTRDGS